MNDRYGIKYRFGRYIIWSVIALIVLLVTDMYFIFSQPKIAALISVITIIYVAVLCIIVYKSQDKVIAEILDMTIQYGQVQKRLIKTLPLPYMLLDEDGEVFWMNDTAREEFYKDQKGAKSIKDYFPELNDKFIMQLQDKAELIVSYEDKIFELELERLEFNSEHAEDSFSGGLISLCIHDRTENFKFKQELEDQKVVVGLIYLDNYDETLGNMDDVKSSLLGALLERKIRKYFIAEDGLVRKMDKDKFMVLLNAKSFRKLEAERFTLLSEIKTVNIGDDVTVTISMGFGIDAPTYADGMNFASAAIELALGRGGDQAVIKTPTEQAYYGGSTSQMNRNTRVKARVKAQAFRELVQNAESVFIMGHKLADVDAFGAAIGVAGCVKSLEKKVHIVLDEATASVKLFKDLYNKEENLFVTGEQALAMCNGDSVVVVVDANRPSVCECEALLSKTRNIAVFDHHRQGSEGIRNAILAYIEPYASSACEMVTEMLPYFDENIRLSRDDADCLYAGIVIDTNNFNTKTGVRTFEAAAYLRRNGADVTRVRRMLREDMESYRSKAQVILSTEVYQNEYAIGVCVNEKLESPTVTGAQAANELLNIIGVRASFVLTPFKGLIYISARSEDLNVQVIMERLGGGGHINTAGAQLKDVTLDEAKIMVREEIDKVLKERSE